MTTPKKKLIEVALPLEAINKASGHEKSIRHGHPSTLHLWWARRPLAAARAVIFSQMVDDPSAHPDLFPTAKAQEKERQRLFKIIEDLVRWENTTNTAVLKAAQDEIWQSWRHACAENVEHERAKTLFSRQTLPAFHDPFAGGGALPLEAQRLGLLSSSSDLNPIAVLINKAMIEIPPRFAGAPPVSPSVKKDRELVSRQWRGAEGLAQDTRFYGAWIRDEAEKRVGHLYPKAAVSKEVAKNRSDLKPLIGQDLNVIAWIWARTVKSPNPAFAQIDVPLASTFMLSTKVGKESYIEPVIDARGYHFTVKTGAPKDPESAENGTSAGKRKAFTCLMSGVPISYEYIRSEAKAGRMGARLLAMVAEGARGRVYLPPTEEMENIARSAKPAWRPDCEMPKKHRNFQPPVYGMTNLGDIFTSRQLVGLTTLSDLILEVRDQVRRDAVAAGMKDDGAALVEGGSGATAYGDAVATYLAFALSKSVDGSSTICRWMVQRDSLFSTFGRQALPMTWDFAEVNLLADCTRSFSESVAWTAESIEGLAVAGAPAPGTALQADAAKQELARDRVVSTDPPYFDNISYADLSDFFYVWLRRTLKPVYPELFSTLAVPKTDELVASPHRHGGEAKAEAFFLDGMTHAMHRLAEQAHPEFPVTIYYAFKQSESDEEDGTSSTGWETFLGAVINAGFAITGTWPIRTERAVRSISMGNNALASSIVLVCRRTGDSAPSATRREFVNALKAELPKAVAHLQRGNIAPVDLAQAAIGPGMGVFTRYDKVIDASGNSLSVREALALINQTLDESLAQQEGDFDSDSRWALAWFDQAGFTEGEFGVAETLSKAKNTSVKGLVEAGILSSSRGKVRLLKASELPADWDPETDARLTAWEVVHHLIRALDSGGELGAATLVAKLGGKAEVARELAYRLYTLCERKKRAADALTYNGLVQSWPEITRLAGEGGKARAAAQGALFDKDEG
jgi:putative DNA methylase